MKLYIHATGNISAQKTFGHPSRLEEIVKYEGPRLRCVEPDYSSIIDAKLIRRMSRIIKMGVAAAKECLQEAGIENPDAIVTGTAYGCLEDTGIFLKKMVEQNEEMLTPTAFIQSTHNTIGAQIALLLQCHNYNNTFVHRGFSFESALLDAMMLLEEGMANNVLAGGIDEITDISFQVLNRFGLYKRENIPNIDLYKLSSKGSIAGEGAAFFLLSNKETSGNCAVLEGLHTFYKPSGQNKIEQEIQSFLSAQSLTIKDIDIVCTGRNGDSSGDSIYEQLGKTVFKKSVITQYKYLCGEYPTSTAFALWLATLAVKNGQWAVVQATSFAQPIKRVLIYNHYQKIHHSLLLVSAC
jgi:3-oxoacyl-(acyl-carrier-protein) synthase